MKTNIVLIGFMGTGKSSVGRRLARILGKGFVDTDEEIEKVTGLTIPEIFRKHGEIRFRSEEALAVERVAQRDNLVISTGGGVVLNPTNVRLLQQKGAIIRLTAAPEVIHTRVSKRKNRPLLHKDGSVEYIAQLLQKREKYYRCADFTIDTSHLSLNQVVTKVLNFWQEVRPCEEIDS